MIKPLLIVFAKNLVAGRVKTRLAKTIGPAAALEVYKSLLQTTQKAAASLEIDTWVFYSDHLEEIPWPHAEAFVQKGSDLGQRMQNAFNDAFEAGYNSVVLIGSDLPDLSTTILNTAFLKLKTTETVFGPAEDGGYYLIGLRKMLPFIINNKPWSTPQLLKNTLQEIKEHQVSVELLDTLNDIDTFEDLETSGYLDKNTHLHQIISSTHD